MPARYFKRYDILYGIRGISEVMMMSIGAVIVAAGVDDYEGEIKPMLKAGSISIIERIIHTFSQVFVDKIVVVTGNQAEIIEKQLSGTGTIFFRNERYRETDMFYSASIGLKYLRNCDQVFFTPVDVPFFSASTLKSLLDCSGKICIPVYKGKQGHPVLLDVSVLESILSYEGDGGLRDAMKQQAEVTTMIEVDDKGILIDMDAKMTYEAQVNVHTRQLLRPIVDIQLSRENIFFSQLDVHFLEIISETNSVKLACERLKISYSRGWKRLRLIEQNLGEPVVTTARGGIGGGYTELTDSGRELLKNYWEFDNEVKRYANERFFHWFDEFD